MGDPGDRLTVMLAAVAFVTVTIVILEGFHRVLDVFLDQILVHTALVPALRIDQAARAVDEPAG